MLADKIKTIKDFGKSISKYNYPLAPSSMEDVLIPIKLMPLEVDGYSLLVHYNRADHGKFYLDAFQVYSKNAVFLPFNLVLKLGILFLGKENLYLMEIYAGVKKVYCWMTYYDTDENSVEMNLPGKTQEYGGISYKLLPPSEVNIY